MPGESWLVLSTLSALALWCSVTTTASGIALWRSRWLRARTRPHSDGAMPSVTLIRPCAGDEPNLLTRLSDAGGAARVIICLDSEQDSATPNAAHASAALQAADFDSHVQYTNAQGLNHKAAQLAHVIATLGTDSLIATFDSDTEVRGFNLSVEARVFLGSPTLGAVWLPTLEAWQPQRSLAHLATYGILSASLHAFPLLGSLDPKGLVGKAALYKYSALASVGGFSALTGILGEDMELSARLRTAGYDVRMAHTPVRACSNSRSWGAVLRRFSRWIWVIRAQRPHLLASYPLLLASLPLQMLALAIVARFVHSTSCAAVAGACALTLVAVRIAIVARLRALAEAPVSLLLAMASAMIGDVTLLLAWLHTLSSRTVNWRGRILRFDARGELAERINDPRPPGLKVKRNHPYPCPKPQTGPHCLR